MDNTGIHSESTQDQGVWANTDTSLCITAEGVCALLQHACTCTGVWRHVHQNSDHSDDDFYILLLLFYTLSIGNSVYFFLQEECYIIMAWKAIVIKICGTGRRRDMQTNKTEMRVQKESHVSMAN